MKRVLPVLLLVFVCLLYVGADAESRGPEMFGTVRTETVSVPYTVCREEDASLAWGEEQVISEGKEGYIARQWYIEYKGDNVVGRKLLSMTREEPQKKIIHYGTRTKNCTVKVLDSKGGTLEKNGETIPYLYRLRLTATAYTAGEGLVDEITATGTRVRRGVVAVDRRVIPLGSKVYVESTDSTPSYGFAVAEDTGVLGNAIDLYMEDYTTCMNFGRREVDVYVLA